MSENKRLSERNAKIAAMLSDGEQLKNFYRFIAQNPYINLHDACQIVNRNRTPGRDRLQLYGRMERFGQARHERKKGNFLLRPRRL